MRELKKLLKDLNLAIVKIKDIDRKFRAKVKSVVLEGKKLDRVTSKALMAKMPGTSETTIKRLLNIQKHIVEGLQFKAYNLSAPSIWVDDPEMYAHLKCKVLWPTFGPRLGCISQTIKKGGPRAGKTLPKPGGLGSHSRQTLCVGLPG
ncbi:hypothetical protein DSO57_1007528 [Entomophthora muscae]|uniref:Uncharacterized protein n=1 Tax=Entomophthora muscae TaxID=34485 RepID=A0ACC2UT83_9FUNG|nr:hypothetical protein DSO57_1007528 [Entomophthora muscae]